MKTALTPGPGLDSPDTSRNSNSSLLRRSGRLSLAAGIVLVSLIAVLAAPRADADRLSAGFSSPPPSARPWVYWFWLNGNITKEGITADLEAMKRVGIGGALIMEVDQGAPVGPIDFAGPEWRTLFKHVLSEANRLGLRINMNGDAGWCGSGGPWITPDRAMQKVVWTETQVDGPVRFDGVLKQPAAVSGYYRDIALYAYPTPGEYRIPDVRGKSGLVRQDIPPRTEYDRIPDAQVIPISAVRLLTSLLRTDGGVTWDVPPGKWTLLRMGYTPTGAVNAPAPATGRGLECDKLSKEGAEAAFNGLIGKLIADSPALTGKSLVSMHIDSWEMGSQNWTARFPQEFLRLRGYDPTPYLPVFTGRVVGSPEQSERFLWDIRQTISDLVAENYAGHMCKLANRAGLRLSIEAYGDAVFDDIRYGGMADEPMTEFWSSPGNFTAGIAHEMASAAHVYGKRILGAEAFTAGDAEKWLLHPGAVKTLGDWAFCRGVNRFVVHRFAMQPWLDRAPGMSMGPWGLHYERTQTWWNLSRPWHDYLARCQYLLQQGLPVADILYLEPEGAPRSFSPPAEPDRHGYRSDTSTADALLHRVTVRRGRLTLPDGMSYRMLVLPNVATMTLPLLRRVAELANQGAYVIGPRPVQAPGLAGYPACDAEVKRIAGSLWSSGKVKSAGSVEANLRHRGVMPDFTSNRILDFTHRRIGADEVYFVANGSRHPVNATCTFRVAGRSAELWDPESGDRRPVPIFEAFGSSTRMPLRLEAGESVFVVFRSGDLRQQDHIVRLLHGGNTILPNGDNRAPGIRVIHATWGPHGDPLRTKDVTSQVSRLVAEGKGSFVVAELASGGDPAVNVIKTLNIEYDVNGKRMTVSATDPETVEFELPGDSAPAVQLARSAAGSLTAIAGEPGRYTAITARGSRLPFTVHEPPVIVESKVPWDVSFPKNSGAPGRIRLGKLISLSRHTNPGVRYFSGVATYTGTIDIPGHLANGKRSVTLDLGRVEVMAQVTLNGRDLGVLWHAPYRKDVTDAVHAGSNRLTLRVANLWPNRLIGDEQLAEDSPRQKNGTLAAWPRWLIEGKPSPTGRFTFTSWRLWSKTSALPASGLIGPVQLRFAPLITLRPEQIVVHRQTRHR